MEKSLDSKQALLEAAKRVFAQHGLDGATVKDLSDAAGVNVSLVSYYFGGKEGLYEECLGNFAEDRWQMILRILKPADSVEELKTRLQMLADEMIEVHVREPELCLIIHRDIQNLNPTVTHVFKNVFVKIFETLIVFLESAEKEGLIRPLKNMEVSASLVFGSLLHLLQSEPHRRVLGRPSITDPKVRETTVKEWLDYTYHALASTELSEKK